MHDLDDFDRQLLELLSIDSRQTGRQLSEAVGLSPAACLRRVQRLRETGAIEKEIAVISPGVTGPSVTLLVKLLLERGGRDRIDLLRRRLLKLPGVKKIYHVTGDADFVLVLRCPSMEDYATFTEAHFYAPEIKGFETIVVLREYDSERAGAD